MEGKNCISCKKKIINDFSSTVFKCPQCGNYELIRCTNCRANATKYHCPNCEFTGPN